MATPQPAPLQGQHKHACSLCARRKVKCDKGDPCSNCIKAQTECLYEVPAQPRPRKRAADEDLLVRLASYEDLMRKHNVDYTHHAHTWITSGLQGEVKQDDSQTSAFTTPTANHHDSKALAVKGTPAAMERCLWATLPAELKYPPVQSLCRNEDTALVPTPSLYLLLTSDQPEISQLHPEPRQIYRLWQIFIETVNPLTKIVHVPTLQKRVLDASWNPSSASKSFTAILFALYTLAVTSASSEECLATFGEARSILLPRYRNAAFRALAEADFLTTRDFEVLQALVLFLFADPDSELTSTLTGAAIRIGQKIGLHRQKPDPKTPIFEREMRVRLWWQLHGMDTRVRAAGKRLPPSESEFGDVRLPFNVNDAELDPDMTELPVEHTGPTEMLCVLMKFEVFNWVRSSATAVKLSDILAQSTAKNKTSTVLEDQAIDELEARYHEKFLRHLDRNIPLHALTETITKLAIARMRCKVHSPRGRAAHGREVLMTREENDVLFNSILTWLEMMDAAMRSKFSSHLIAHMATKYTADAYVYMISDLRRRCSGEHVALAWKLVERLYEEHPELIEDTQNTFFVALGDLTLEAWEARRKELVNCQEINDFNSTPRFVQLLWNKRQDKAALISPVPVTEFPNFDVIGLTDDGELDWEYWNDFLRL